MKLRQEPGTNVFLTNNGRPFANSLITSEVIDTSFHFAYNMVYGPGHHRNYRSGGSHLRKKGEKFCNTMQGKIAEILLFREFQSQGINVGEIDLGIYGQGVWDVCDINYREKKISVKSCAHFSNLLLLECSDYDRDGNYLPDSIDGEKKTYDYFVMVRIKPDLKRIFKQHRLFYSDEDQSSNFLQNILIHVDWRYDIPGFISNENFKVLIQRNYLIPKNSYLNTTTKMDTDNYYIQAGNLRRLSDLITDLSGL